MNDAIGGFSRVRFDISGYNLTNKLRLFSTDKCLHNQTNIIMFIIHIIQAMNFFTEAIEMHDKVEEFLVL